MKQGSDGAVFFFGFIVSALIRYPGLTSRYSSFSDGASQRFGVVIWIGLD